MNHTITSPIAPTQMRTDAALGRAGIGIVTIIQNHRLDITEKGFHRIVIRATLGQRNPMQLQRTHRPTGLTRFTWMRPILIEGYPHVVGRIPTAYLLHELAHCVGAFAWHERPVGSPTVDLIEEKEVELSPSLLLPSQYELFGRGIASTTIGFDRDDFGVKEQQLSLRWSMAPEHAQTAQNRTALGIVADQFALDAA